MVERRFQTLMLRREKKQSEKETEIFPQQKFQQHPNFSENVPEEIIQSFTNVENRSLDRSFCSVAQELTAELEYLLPASKPAASKKRDPDSVEDLEGLDALAKVAIQEEGGSLQESSQTTTTKHPRHRPGCSCVCSICLMVERRFQTLMLRREKKQSEKETEIFPQQKFQHHPNFSENVPEEIIRSFTNVENRSLDRKMMNGEDFSNDDVSRITSSVSPFKGQIDLNSQPERDDELSPRPDSDVVKRIMENAFERDLRLLQ